MSNETFIVQACRTPIGSYGGILSEFSAPQLGAKVIAGLFEQIDISMNKVDEVIMGNVLSAGIGQAPARQASLYSGLPNKVECLTINKMCGSGLKAIMLGDSIIKSNGSELIIAGGMESMSNAPLLMSKSINMIGHQRMIDSMLHDGLWDAYNDMHMGNCAELLATERNYTREEQDKYSVRSYRRAQEAQQKGYFDSEIIPLMNTKEISIVNDEEPARAKFEKIPMIKPVFEKDGTITAANASKLNDGAAAVMLMSKENIEKYNMKPIARILSHCSFAHDPKWFTTAPGGAIKKVLIQAGLSTEDIDIWEINEAFAAVTMAAIDDFNLDDAKVNIHGGAVALGHPIGASGARILTTLIYALERTKKNIGLATLCIGGGEASAMVIEKL
ncbi:MAG: acetyl-CoA C-acyltransferase [Candidatus Marinimicrobia bacterium]|nr:acetyl-CoA C-acyltransferase [Candidatus Neomarinimicrobiota bacterium]|tara:strand:- start:1452 stop:2615 length:1164 start_codon:yes stop_codon:yes gene_type:complete